MEKKEEEYIREEQAHVKTLDADAVARAICPPSAAPGINDLFTAWTEEQEFNSDNDTGAGHSEYRESELTEANEAFMKRIEESIK